MASKASTRGASKAGQQKTAQNKTARTKVLQQEEPQQGVVVRAWNGLAHAVGGAARAFRVEPLDAADRRDGVPLLLVLLAIVGAVIEWFMLGNPVASQLGAWTFGGLFGRVAFGLPIVMLGFALWLFNNPSSVNDNRRIAIGLFIALLCASGLCHLFGGQPDPWNIGVVSLADAGGLFGWLIGTPLAYLTMWVAVPLLVVLLFFSLLIITKTPPSRIVRRLREGYAYLFGLGDEMSAQPSEATKKRDREKPADEQPEGGSMPWWRRNESGREEDPDYVADERALDKVLGDSDGAFESALAPDAGTDVVDDGALTSLEDAVRAAGGAHASGLGDDSWDGSENEATQLDVFGESEVSDATTAFEVAPPHDPEIQAAYVRPTSRCSLQAMRPRRRATPTTRSQRRSSVSSRSSRSMPGSLVSRAARQSPSTRSSSALV